MQYSVITKLFINLEEKVYWSLACSSDELWIGVAKKIRIYSIIIVRFYEVYYKKWTQRNK